MEHNTLLKPTLYIEIILKIKTSPAIAKGVCDEIAACLGDKYVSLKVGTEITNFGGEEDDMEHAALIERVSVADYTGPNNVNAFHQIGEVQLDVKSYFLRSDSEPTQRRRISQSRSDDDSPQARVLALPNIALRDEWDSLIYEDALPSQLLRYLTRMLGVMKQPGLNLSTFNWNRLCLLHGPPGSGKSTLCRALAQKLSIRLSQTFPHTVLVEVNTNSMLSKYFGESGRLINALFEKIYSMAQSSTTLVCVVMDEVENIASSRQRVATAGECSDGLRATNQLLTALDRVRALPNVIILCTSNLIDAIDPAFVDRVDIKQLIPSPSLAAIYNIFRSCLNELVRASLIDAAALQVSSSSSTVGSASPSSSPSKRRAITPSSKKPASSPPNPTSPSPEKWELVTVPIIPTFSETQIMYQGLPDSPGQRIWRLAQRCEGFSGRTLRRLPILGLAMYTWGGNCSLQDAVSALTSAVEQELKAKQGNTKE